MGYDVHLVRTREWFDSGSDPVTKEDVESVMQADATLSWSESDYVEMRAASGSVHKYFMINWNDEPVFWWYRSEIRCKNPSDAQLLKLVEIATLLGARVVGDEGETYTLGEGRNGHPKVVVRGA